MNYFCVVIVRFALLLIKAAMKGLRKAPAIRSVIIKAEAHAMGVIMPKASSRVLISVWGTLEDCSITLYVSINWPMKTPVLRNLNQRYCTKVSKRVA